MLIWNQPAFTRRCIESVLAHTRTPVRLLLVDNGSDAPTQAHLASVASRGSVQVQTLRNETNEGFARGMNRGLRASGAPWVCLLNNDTVVTDGWLERMLAVGQAHPEIGLINPSSNTFNDRPGAGTSLAAHAATAAGRTPEYVEVGTCVGFCWLIRRAVIEAIGVLDESSGLAFFEDTEYCRRAAQAGWQSAVAQRAYVWHAEHQTVRRLPQRQRLFRENQRRFEARWGRLLRLAYVVRPQDAGAPKRMASALRWAVATARRGAIVQLWIPTAQRVERNALFAAAGLVPHADVQCIAAPRDGWRLTVWMWRRLVSRRLSPRRPKLFDFVIIDDVARAQRLTEWRWWHGADILSHTDGDTLNRLWQSRSRSQSS